MTLKDSYKKAKQNAMRKALKEDKLNTLILKQEKKLDRLGFNSEEKAEFYDSICVALTIRAQELRNQSF